MQPDQPYQPQQLPMTQSTQTPIVVHPGAPSKPKKNKVLIFSGTGLGVLILIILIVVLMVTSSKPKQTPQTPQSANQSGALQPASALSIQEANNRIGQDISTVNDENDLPVDMLSDKNLGL